MERDAHFLNRLYISFWAPSKGAPPPGSPHRAPIERARFLNRLYISFWAPSKGAPPPGSPHRAPIERAPFPKPSFIRLFRVCRKNNPLQVPQWGPYGEGCPSPEPSFTCLSDSPVKVLLMEKSHPSLEVPRKGASTPCCP